jgi:nicotinate-nucleotide adenylyltransferase
MTDSIAPKRVALYGGSFNPPHHCHVLVATWALCRGGVDEVWLLPAAGHAFGKQLESFELRCLMLEKAVAHLGPRVKVERIEDSLPKPSYTVDTLSALLSREPLELTLVLGTDAYAERHKWKQWARIEELLENRVIVVGREGHPVEGTSPDIVLPDLSSTEVRKRVAANEPIWWLVPPSVEEQIRTHDLYQD